MAFSRGKNFSFRLNASIKIEDSLLRASKQKELGILADAKNIIKIILAVSS